MLRFLDETLFRVNGRPPKVAVLVTAWDLVDLNRRDDGPVAYLRTEFPLFAGRLSDCSTLDVRVFGVSIVGGDFEDAAFTARFHEGDVNEMGYVVADDDDGVTQKIDDVSLPVAWIVGPIFENV
jgi:hypothetical protein